MLNGNHAKEILFTQERKGLFTSREHSLRGNSLVHKILATAIIVHNTWIHLKAKVTLIFILKKNYWELLLYVVYLCEQF